MLDQAGHVGGELFGCVAPIGTAGPSGPALVGHDDVVAGEELADLVAPAGADAGQPGQQQYGRAP